MCGILAKTGQKSQPQTIRAALETLAHRGPDDFGALSYEGCTLGHTRLSIIDITSNGHQPMKNKDEPVAISFNGEIYNYHELKNDLKKKGYKFNTSSDTEVILKTYLAYGEQCVQYLDGMFAFVIWDERTQKLFIARDRFGKKPLYYAFDEHNEIVVASEIKALVAMGIRPKIDPAGIDAYLAFMYSPPWRTIYKNIFPLPPASYGIFKDGTLDIKRYWILKKEPMHTSYEEAKNHTRELLTQAIKKRILTADVEIGAFLSGGVDSTLITAYAQHFIDHPIKTFSVGYDGPTSEIAFAKQAADTIGTNHKEFHVSCDNIEILERVMEYFDEPHADSANLAQYILSEHAAHDVKVALAGDGGDELFLGYGWYHSYWNRPKLASLKNILTFATPHSEHLRSITQFSRSERRKLFITPPQKEVDMNHYAHGQKSAGIEKINYFDITTYLPGQLLSKVDQMSMRHSLEVRCPFLDYKLAEYVYNLPIEFKTNKKTGKIILKDILAEIMPREFVDRKKQGFGAPVRRWLETPKMKAYALKTLGQDAFIYTILNKTKVERYIQRAYSGTNSKQYYQVWIILCLELWLKKHQGFYEI